MTAFTEDLERLIMLFTWLFVTSAFCNMTSSQASHCETRLRMIPCLCCFSHMSVFSNSSRHFPARGFLQGRNNRQETLWCAWFAIKGKKCAMNISTMVSGFRKWDCDFRGDDLLPLDATWPNVGGAVMLVHSNEMTICLCGYRGQQQWILWCPRWPHTCI